MFLYSVDIWKYLNQIKFRFLEYLHSGIFHSRYRELTKYDYQDPDQYNHDKEKVEEIGHFTQLVWDNTNRFGLAISVRPDLGRVYIVAPYSKAGNNAYGNEPFREHVRRQKISEGLEALSLMLCIFSEILYPCYYSLILRPTNTNILITPKC